MLLSSLIQVYVNRSLQMLLLCNIGPCADTSTLCYLHVLANSQLIYIYIYMARLVYRKKQTNEHEKQSALEKLNVVV